MHSWSQGEHTQHGMRGRLQARTRGANLVLVGGRTPWPPRMRLGWCRLSRLPRCRFPEGQRAGQDRLPASRRASGGGTGESSRVGDSSRPKSQVPPVPSPKVAQVLAGGEGLRCCGLGLAQGARPSRVTSPAMATRATRPARGQVCSCALSPCLSGYTVPLWVGGMAWHGCSEHRLVIHGSSPPLSGP